jgi:hypothetical protein
MAELAALNVKLTGDATGLRSALQSAEDGLENVALQARQTTQQTAAVSTGMGRLGAAFGRHSFAISNAANQFSDLAVQIGMGVPATRALSQQLPQMTAMMGPLATVIGVASGVLIGLAGNFFAASDGADEFTNSLEALDRIQSDLNTANEILRMSVVELRQEYGAYADAVLRAAQSMAILAEAEAAQRMRSALQDFAGELDRLTSTGRMFDTAMTTALQRIREEFGLTGTQAQQFHGLLLDLETATTFDQQVEALRQIEEFMAQTGVNAAQLPPELIGALQQLNQMVIASADVAAGLSEAADQGARLSASLPFYAPEGRGAPMSAQPGMLQTMGAFAAGPGEQDARGGGGRGVSLADQIQADLETLQEGFLSQEELQIASYQRQQETLQQALNQRLVTQQEYARMMEQVEQSHQFAMVRAANDGARQTLSNLATVFQGSKEIGAGIALANSWLAFTEVLKDPSFIGRPFARVAAAGAALSSGLQAVRNIKSASRGGGGASSAGSSVGMAQTASGGAAAGGGTSRNVAIQLTGGDMFSRDQVIRLINAINESVEDGAIVRLA